MDKIILALVTGLTAGGISCLAVQGGLLTGAIAQISTPSQKRLATISFLLSKLIAYTFLGFLLGAFGEVLQITPTLQGWLQIAAGIYMLCVSANLLNIHPIFRYTVIQPPKWAYKLIKKESQKFLLGPTILGALTVLIPCGITQGMMIAAIASGSAVMGGAILFAFTIGASPIFFILGMTAGELMKKRAFVYLSSALIATIGVSSISSGQVLRGSTQNLSTYWNVIVGNPNASQILAKTNDLGYQSLTIVAKTSGYSASANTLKVGVPVNLKIVSENAAGCVQVFTIPSMNIKKLIPQNGEEVLTFTPTETGRIAFSCAMGMYNGEFLVI